ncbi:hypothetical protein OIU76_014683 [Salix suchowensis]|nr:hypothetical protein OIU76_014683 [Salix suchowensis]
MGFLCCSGKSSKRSESSSINENNSNIKRKDQTQVTSGTLKMKPCVNNLRKEGESKDDQLSLDVKSLNIKDEISKDRRSNGKQAQTFTFEELATATGNFKSDCFLGEGGFGKVYKGHLDKINQGTFLLQCPRCSFAYVHRSLVEFSCMGQSFPPVTCTKLLASPLSVLLSNSYPAAARPMFKDRRNFSYMVDPLLQGHYPVRGLYQALAIAAMCVQEQPNMRPAVSDLVMALNYLASQRYDPQIHSVQDNRSSPSHHGLDKDGEQ